MKQLLFNFLFLSLFVFSVSAQIREAQKIDEFEGTNCCDYGARIDNLLTAVNNSPDSRGYVFVYEGKIKRSVYDKKTKTERTEYVAPEIGMAKEVIGYLKNHVSFRNYPPDKIVFVEEGFRENYTVELWIAPNGVKPPEPTPTLKKIKQLKRKHREFGFCGEI